MKYVLGIDQGGSKTCVMVCNGEGTILGVGYGRGACHSSQGMAAAMEGVSTAASQALDQAGIRTEQLEQIAGGMTGVDWPYEAALLRENLSMTLAVPPERIAVVNDCIIALRAATSSAAGCILCAGSGLNCAVRDGKGREYTYGFYIEDRMQGGAALGRRAIQAVYDGESGLMEKTPLTEAILEHMHCATADELLYRQVSAGLDGAEILAIPRILEAYALGGDPVACEVLRQFGEDIARYVTCGLRKMDMLQSETEVVLSGSIFKCRAPVLVDTVTKLILAQAPHARIIESEYEPVVGGVLLALDQLENIDAALVQKHIKRDAQRFHMVRK